MATQQLVASGFAGTAPTLSTYGYERVVIACALTSTDTVTVSILLNDGTTVAAPDVNGNVSGLSNTTPSRAYWGGPDYVCTKVGVASAPGLFYCPVGNP